MVKRPFWIAQIEQAWLTRSVVWLAGVRRVGKTSLCKSLDSCEYYNCELPSVQNLLQDPEEFFKQRKGKRIVLDEVQVLDDPSRLLKIGADEFPETKIVATGSSALSISKKFSDTLTGRKYDVSMTPLLYDEMEIFENDSMDHRFLSGGLPAFFLESDLKSLQRDFSEWLASHFARDVQELFTVENRKAYLKFMHLMLAESGGIFEATRFAQLCEVSRPTINKYVDVAEQTLTTRLVRPFTTHASSEITRAPKIYSFDTGFICFAKGWQTLRPEDRGILWEHIVLNELIGRLQYLPIKYWRDKQDHEVDFIIEPKGSKEPIALECKLSAYNFDVKNIRAFRNKYPLGENFVIAKNVSESFVKKYDDILVTFISLSDLTKVIQL